MFLRRLSRVAAPAARRVYSTAASAPPSASPSASASTPPSESASTPPPERPTPPLLTLIREDLKAAMRSQDKPALSLLRNVLAEITNAAKTPRPPTTDVHVLAILTRMRGRTQVARADAAAAGRADLADAADRELAELDRYIAQVCTVHMDEIRRVVRSVREDMQEPQKMKMGDVMRAAKKRMEGQNVVKADLVAAIKQIIKEDKR